MDGGEAGEEERAQICDPLFNSQDQPFLESDPFSPIFLVSPDFLWLPIGSIFGSGLSSQPELVLPLTW